MKNDSPTTTDGEPCFICEQEPGTVEALADDKPVLVCRACFAYETGEDPDDLRDATDDEEAA